MKRKILALLVLTALVVCAMCSCFGAVADKGNVTVVIANRDGTYTEYKASLEDVENKDDGAAGLLEHLAAREKNALEVDMQDSTYGKFVNSIGSLVPDGAAGEYISIYTSNEADFSTYAGAAEKDYNGTKLMTSGVGISDMSVVEGVIIFFCIEVYTG